MTQYIYNPAIKGYEKDVDPQMQLVGQRTGQNGRLSSVDASRDGSGIRLNNYSQHLIPTGATSLKLVYAGWYMKAQIPGENPIEPNVFEADRILTMTGGAGYAIGEVLTFPNKCLGDALKIMITSVAGGVPVTAEIIDGGVYMPPYTSQTGATISVTSVNRSATYTAGKGYLTTVVTTDAHGLVTGAPVIIAGATPAGYNGMKQVTVVDATTFTFYAATTLTTPAEGTITAVNSITHSSSTASGTGVTFTLGWKGYAAIGKIGIEPDATHSNVFTGQYAVVCAKKGMKADGTIERRIKVPMSGVVETDIIPVYVPVGGKIGIRATWSGGNLPTGREPISTVLGAPANIEGAYKGTDLGFDKSNNGTVDLGESNSAFIFQPAAIMGTPIVKLPTFLAIADSRTDGTASGIGTANGRETLDADGNTGPLERALNQTRGCFYPVTNFAKGGLALAHLYETSVPNLSGRQALLDMVARIKPTAVYMYLRTNDIYTSQPYATVKDREQRLIAELRGCGVKYIFTSTMEPETASTDDYVTLENQSLATTNSRNAGMETLRNQINDELVAGTYANYDFVVDNRLVSEPYLNSGKWIVNGQAGYATSDGVHASQIMSGLQADSIAAAIRANIPADGS